MESKLTLFNIYFLNKYPCSCSVWFTNAHSWPLKLLSSSAESTLRSYSWRKINIRSNQIPIGSNQVILSHAETLWKFIVLKILSSCLLEKKKNSISASLPVKISSSHSFRAMQPIDHVYMHSVSPIKLYILILSLFPKRLLPLWFCSLHVISIFNEHTHSFLVPFNCIWTVIKSEYDQIRIRIILYV